MQLGALCPFLDIGGDPDTVRDYAQGLEAAGFDFLEAADHVLGANVASPAPRGAITWPRPRVIAMRSRICSEAPV